MLGRRVSGELGVERLVLFSSCTVQGREGVDKRGCRRQHQHCNNDEQIRVFLLSVVCVCVVPPLHVVTKGVGGIDGEMRGCGERWGGQGSCTGHPTPALSCTAPASAPPFHSYHALCSGAEAAPLVSVCGPSPARNVTSRPRRLPVSTAPFLLLLAGQPPHLRPHTSYPNTQRSARARFVFLPR